MPLMWLPIPTTTNGEDMRTRLIALLATLAMVLAACGSDGAEDTTTSPTGAADTTTPMAAAETTTPAGDDTTTTAAPDTTTPSDPASVPEGPVTLAVMGPFTGAAASIGQEQLNFARLAVQSFNEETGWDVQLFEGDTELDAALALTVAAGIIADASVYGVVGPAGSQEVEAIGEDYTEADLAFVSPSATGTDLSASGFGAFFRVVPTDDVQGPTIGNYIQDELGASSVFVIDDQSSYSVGLADQISTAVTEGGGEIAGRESVTQDLSDFSSLATLIGSSGAEVVAFPGQIASQGAVLARALLDQGVEATIFGGDGFFSEADFIEAAGGATEGAYVSSFAPDITGIAGAEEVAAQFQEEYGDFGTFGPPTYVSAQVVLEAMLRSFEANGELARSGVLEEVAATDLESTILGGPLSFEDDGDVVGAQFYIFQVEDGQFVLRSDS